LRKRLAAALGLILTIGTAGCGLRMISPMSRIDRNTIPEMTESNTPVHIDGEKLQFTVDATIETPGDVRSATLPYDPMLWRCCGLLFVVADKAMGDCDRVFIDTGMVGGAALCLVTPDIVARRKLPTRWGLPYNSSKPVALLGLAYVDRLNVGGLTIRRFQAVIVDQGWQYRILGLPVWQSTYWCLGARFLRAAHFLRFDNAARKLTFEGKESFAPDLTRRWVSYQFVMRDDDGAYLRLPVAGKEIEVLFDSGWGRKLTLSQADWDSIKSSVEVSSHAADKIFTWGGNETVDNYKVKNLPIGDTTLGNTIIQVCSREQASVIGLAFFDDAVVVLDYEKSKLWIGTRRDTD